MRVRVCVCVCELETLKLNFSQKLSQHLVNTVSIAIVWYTVLVPNEPTSKEVVFINTCQSYQKHDLSPCYTQRSTSILYMHIIVYADCHRLPVSIATHGI